MSISWLAQVPEVLQGDAKRLLDVSPLFVSLMSNVSEQEAVGVFLPLESAKLPNHNGNWFPSCDSDELSVCLSHLRQIKKHGMRHILWWELGLHGDMQQSYHAITCLAEGLLSLALQMSEKLLLPRFGQLENASFCVVGLGKLGGRELNLGSDVDPLFIWQGMGETTGGRKSVAANEYFAHFAKMLIKLMAEPSEGGIVWPVDMRLRPGGHGAPICLNLDATLSHYLDYGQTWERAMLIKARPVAGDLALGETFVQEVAPFVFRRYLDYSSVVALADMKHRIDMQAGLAEISAGFDVKRGRGGIREIEFTIQSMQLLHAGRITELRLQEGKLALDMLVAKDFIDAAQAQRLFDAYIFWRRIEHAIQARKGEQTHSLPIDYEAYLSAALGIENIKQAMIAHQTQVTDIFSSRVLPSIHVEVGQASWLSGKYHGDALQVLTDEAQQRIRLALQRMDEQLQRGLLPERSRAQIEAILSVAMPSWLNDNNGVRAVESFAELLHSIAGRAAWVDLLATHQGALAWLIGVLSASGYLAEHIVRNPSWLEWPLAAEREEAEIQGLCAQLDALDVHEDEASFLSSMGRLVDQGRIRCALAIDAHQAGPVQVGQWLSDIADHAVLACFRSSVFELKLPPDFPLLALALGKHGSQEMGLVSDLDMVFVLAGNAEEEIHGKSSREWAQRLGRRMIRQLTGVSPFGAGFEFDARLRPSGNSGVLVTTMQGFHDYQLNEAHTWEHQALCRARVVNGSIAYQQELQRVIEAALSKPRDEAILKAEVKHMRQKMLNHLSSKDSNFINLKQDQGGLVDIEFLAQFSRLAYGKGSGQGLGTVQTFLHLPASAPNKWHEKSAWLADTYIDFRQMENALRVELWASIGKLPVDGVDTIWETMRRHASIQEPQTLQNRMQQVHACFMHLLA